jgi:hypothetical protein
VSAIQLVSDGVQRTPAQGVVEAGRSTATLADGSSMLVADAAFEYRNVSESLGDWANALPLASPLDDCPVEAALAVRLSFDEVWSLSSPQSMSLEHWLKPLAASPHSLDFDRVSPSACAQSADALYGESGALHPWHLHQPHLHMVM